MTAGTEKIFIIEIVIWLGIGGKSNSRNVLEIKISSWLNLRITFFINWRVITNSTIRILWCQKFHLKRKLWQEILVASGKASEHQQNFEPKQIFHWQRFYHSLRSYKNSYILWHIPRINVNFKPLRYNIIFWSDHMYTNVLSRIEINSCNLFSHKRDENDAFLSNHLQKR